MNGHGIPDLPKFLRRGTPENKRWLSSKKATALRAVEDPDAWIHEKAKEFGFKRHQYQPHWFRDAGWLASMQRQHDAREAEAAAKRAESERRAAALREERKLMGSGNKTGKAKRAGGGVALSDVPAGRIVVLVKGNPRKAGTVPHERFEKLRQYHGRTVEAYSLDGGVLLALKNALAKGWVRVASEEEIVAERADAGPAAGQTAGGDEPRTAKKAPRRARAEGTGAGKPKAGRSRAPSRGARKK